MFCRPLTFWSYRDQPYFRDCFKLMGSSTFDGTAAYQGLRDEKTNA